MIKSLSYIVFSLYTIGTQAQLIIKPIQKKLSDQYSVPSLRITSAPLALPFWDDFSTAKDSPDTLKWESGMDIFVNATLGQHPPTKNVATFDGVKANGQAHNISDDFSGGADSLVSRPIDLSAVSSLNRNTVYLSFHWQAKGFGEIPEEEDSIVLEFLTLQDTLIWEQQWVQKGGLSNVSERFKFKDIKIPDENKYFHQNFRIKFKSFGSLKGQFDSWHIDYVYLNEHRHKDDSTYIDHSLSGSSGPLFGSYFQIPAPVFFSDPAAFLSQQSILISNLDYRQQPTELSYTLTNENSGEVYLDFDIPDVGVVEPGQIKEAFAPNPNDLSLNIPPFNGDSLVISSTFLYNSGDTLLYEFEVDSRGDTTYFYSPINLRVNDTIKNYYILQNYYAYDDGTAEFAVGVNSVGGQVAQRFVLYKEDTLTHVDLYFPNIAPSSTGKSVDIIVWNKLSEVGELTRQSYLIQAPKKLNQLVRIKLERPVLVKDTIYIGYQQNIDDYIGIGFDRNNPAASENMFSNVEGDWVQNSRLSGSLMIRPVFDFEAALVLSTPSLEIPISVYPNPTDRMVRIKGVYDHLSVDDLSGRELLKSDYTKMLDISFLKDGIYLLKFNKNNSIYTQKVILGR